MFRFIIEYSSYNNDHAYEDLAKNNGHPYEDLAMFGNKLNI